METNHGKEDNFYYLLDKRPQDAILFLNMEGRILEANLAAQELYGYSREQLLTMDIFQMRPAGTKLDHAKALEKLKNAWEKGILVEGVHQSRDGKIIPVEISAQGARTKDGKIIVCIIRDITCRKLAKEKLYKLNQAVEQSASTVVITDAQGVIEYVNPKFVVTTGYSDSEVIGKNPRILKSGANPPEVYKELWETITGGKEWRGELQNRRKDGSLYWEMVAISPLRNSRGQITHYLAIKEDITQRKQAEETLRKVMNELAEREKIMQKQLDLAAKVQRGFLPPDIDNSLMRLEAIYQPSHHVSGDFYDYVLDEDNNTLFGCLIDVMGHGLSTALQTAALRVLFKQTADMTGGVAQKLSWLNDAVVPYFAEDVFAAAILFEIDFNSKTLTYASGGINYFIAHTKARRGIVKVPGMFLGMLAHTEYEQYTLPFASGDGFVFLSDGLLEMIPAGKMALLNGWDDSCKILRQIVEKKPKDDATAVIIQIK